MGKDSAYYKDKKKKQTLKLRELMSQLPSCAKDFLYDKEMTSQTSTLVSYAYDLLTFFRYLQYSNPTFSYKSVTDFTIEDLAKLTSEDISEYQRYLELNEDGEKHENGKKDIEKNPMILVKLPRIKKDKNIIRMNENEVADILNTVEFGNAQMSKHQLAFRERTRERDLAIMTLMLGTGIRVSECAGLDLTDVDLRANTITIVRKGGGQDILYFGEEIHDALQTYIEGERNRTLPESGEEAALFLSLHKRRISVDSIELLVKKYAKMSVPNKKITPHKLRSTYGTALYRETGDIRLVADVLGHENVNTTIDYYAAIEDEHKRQAANAVSLRNKNK